MRSTTSRPRLGTSVWLGLLTLSPVASAQEPPDRAAPALNSPAGRTCHGLVVIPYAGVHTGENSSNTQAGPGPRVGAVVGGYVLDTWSLDVQIGVDWLSGETLMPGESASRTLVEGTFSPLYHAKSHHLQVIAGPKLGAWLARGSDRLRGALEASTFSAKGSSIGGNLGLLGLVGRGIWAGALASAEVRDTISGCSTDSGFLTGCPRTGDASAVLGLTVALLL